MRGAPTSATRNPETKKYKGRGPIQITGRYNYTQAGAALKLPLVDQPQIDRPAAARVSRVGVVVANPRTQRNLRHRRRDGSDWPDQRSA